MRILHVTPSFYPATYFGGPIWTTYALCNALAAQTDVELRVLTTDAAGQRASSRVAITDFPAVYPPGYDVYFTRRIAGSATSPGLLARLGKMIGWADAVLLTGTYSFPTIPTLLCAALWTNRWCGRHAVPCKQVTNGARRGGLS